MRVEVNRCFGMCSDSSTQALGPQRWVGCRNPRNTNLEPPASCCRIWSWPVKQSGAAAGDIPNEVAVMCSRPASRLASGRLLLISTSEHHCFAYISFLNRVSTWKFQRDEESLFGGDGSGKFVSFSLKRGLVPVHRGCTCVFWYFTCPDFRTICAQEECNEEGNPALGCLPRKMEVSRWHGQRY